MVDHIAFYIPGKPQAKERPRFGGHVYSSKKTPAFEARVAGCAAKAMASREPLEGALSMHIHFAIKQPQKWTRSHCKDREGRYRPFAGGDIDNLCKAVMDGCNGIVYGDDRQVVDLTSTKIYAPQDGVTVDVEVIG